MAQATRSKQAKAAAAQWPWLCNVESHDAHQCTVGESGPSCYIVQNAVRVLGDLGKAAAELGISPKAAAQAVEYAERWPRKSSESERELFAHAAVVLFADA